MYSIYVYVHVQALIALEDRQIKCAYAYSNVCVCSEMRIKLLFRNVSTQYNQLAQLLMRTQTCVCDCAHITSRVRSDPFTSKLP